MKVNLIAEGTEKSTLAESVMLTPTHCNVEPGSPKVTISVTIFRKNNHCSNYNYYISTPAH